MRRLSFVSVQSVLLSPASSYVLVCLHISLGHCSPPRRWHRHSGRGMVSISYWPNFHYGTWLWKEQKVSLRAFTSSHRC